MQIKGKCHSAGPKERRGATLVEFAFVSPLVFFLIFALVEFGRMVMVQQAVTNAAREGCRKAALVTTQTQTQVDDAVRAYLQTITSNASDSSKVRINVSPAALAATTTGTAITVDVDVNFSDVSWLGGLSNVFGDPVIRGQATQERE